MRLQKHQLAALSAHDRLVAAGHASATDFVMPPPLPRKKRSREESIMQCALLKWWAANHKHFGVHEWLLFAIPNGMRKGAITGAILKREGVRRGVPDLMLAVARSAVIQLRPHERTAYRHGLFLELKTPTGIVTPEQQEFHRLLADQGYKVCVVRSLIEGINAITTYLK